MIKPKNSQLVIALLLIVFFVITYALLNKNEAVPKINTASDRTSQATKIKIGYKKHIAYLPFFVAMEKNFFTYNGLMVETVAFDSTNLMLSSVVAGKIDASIGGPNLPTVLSLAEKSPDSLKIFSESKTLDNALFTCVMIKKNSALTGLKDLKGKKIGIWPGGFPLLWLEDTLKTVGLKNTDVKEMVVEDKLQLAALESNQVDALFTIEPLCLFGVNKKVGKIIYDNPLNNTTKIFAVSIISNNFIKNNKPAADNLVKSIEQAIDYINSQPGESLAIMAKWAGYEAEMIKGMDIPQFSKLKNIDTKAIEELAAELREKKLLEAELDIKKLIY